MFSVSITKVSQLFQVFLQDISFSILHFPSWYMMLERRCTDAKSLTNVVVVVWGVSNLLLKGVLKIRFFHFFPDFHHQNLKREGSSTQCLSLDTPLTTLFWRCVLITGLIYNNNNKQQLIVLLHAIKFTTTPEVHSMTFHVISSPSVYTIS